MREGRGARLGKYIAKSINQYSTPEFQEAVKKPSWKKIVREILSSDFVSRKEGSKNPVSNKSELEEIPYEEFNIDNPKHYAALLRERGHINYNAGTANRIRDSLLEHL